MSKGGPKFWTKISRVGWENPSLLDMFDQAQEKPEKNWGVQLATLLTSPCQQLAAWLYGTTYASKKEKNFNPRFFQNWLNLVELHVELMVFNVRKVAPSSLLSPFGFSLDFGCPFEPSASALSDRTLGPPWAGHGARLAKTWYQNVCQSMKVSITKKDPPEMDRISRIPTVHPSSSSSSPFCNCSILRTWTCSSLACRSHIQVKMHVFRIMNLKQFLGASPQSPQKNASVNRPRMTNLRISDLRDVPCTIPSPLGPMHGETIKDVPVPGTHPIKIPTPRMFQGTTSKVLLTLTLKSSAAEKFSNFLLLVSQNGYKFAVSLQLYIFVLDWHT